MRRWRPLRCNFRSAIRSSPRSFRGRFSAAQVEQNLGALRQPIPLDLWADLKQGKLIRADAPTPGRRKIASNCEAAENWRHPLGGKPMAKSIRQPRRSLRCLLG
jgi:hypothetical protein